MGIENLEYINGSSGSEEDEVESENLVDDDIFEEMEDENIDETGEMSEKQKILRNLELRFRLRYCYIFSHGLHRDSKNGNSTSGKFLPQSLYLCNLMV